jgi:Glu-tRNA(Gln) amidotransferase subunit E-like FAD-binding protein
MADGNGNGRIDRIEDALASLISTVASLTDVTRLIAGQVNQLAEAQIEIQDTVADLAEQVVALAESQRVSREQTEEALRRLAEAQQHTDERLNALIETVDDIIRRTSRPPPS